MTDLSMKRRIVNVLLGLQMLSEGGTYRWDQTRTSATGDAALPVTFTRDGALREHEWSPYEFHRWRIQTSRSTDDLQDRVLAAEKALREARTGVEPGPDDVPQEPAQLRLWVLINCRKMRAIDVAERSGMSVSWVRQLRERAGQHPNTGEEVS